MFKYITLTLTLVGTNNFPSACLSAESSGGMPQLNPSYFSSQIFWLIIFFCFVFFFINSFFFPKLSKIRENREKVIDECLAEAKRIHKEIEELSFEMEKNLKEAKEIFDKNIKSEFENNKKSFEKEVDSLNEMYDKKKLELNDQILIIKKKLSQDMDKLAVELSDQIYNKVMNEKITGNISELKKMTRGNG